jgi:hypothetical protein
VIFERAERGTSLCGAVRRDSMWVGKGRENQSEIPRAADSKVKARIGGTPSPGPPPDEVHRDCGPPSPPRGRGTFISVGGFQAHDHSE